MTLGRQGERQSELMVTWREMPRSPGHVFYDRLQQVLIEAGFDAFAEATCKPYHAAKMGAPSIPPGRCFRTHIVGYFEGIDSERGIELGCADSQFPRAFLRLETTGRVPDRSWLSKTRSRLPAGVDEHVFSWVLKLIAERGLVRGERIGLDASTMESNAALRTIVRRETGEGYREMLERMAKDSGIETPTAEDRIRLDGARKGKTLSNADGVSPTDPEAKIAKMKDGNTHLACKPEHAVDLDTGTAVAAEIRPADEGERTMLKGTLQAVETNLDFLGMAPNAAQPADLVADKGYHSRAVLKDLDGGVWKTRTSSPRRKDFPPGTARRGGAACRLRQPRPPALRGGQGGDAAPGRDRRALVRAHPRSRPPAPGVVARWRERTKALRDRGLRPEPWVPSSPADRRRHAQGGRPPRAAGRCSSLSAPTKPWCWFFSPSTKAASASSWSPSPPSQRGATDASLPS